MKKNPYILLLMIVFLISCRKEPLDHSQPCVMNFADSSSVHPRASVFQGILNEYVKKGLPGIVMLVHDSGGVWIGAAGKADIENHIAMQPCMVSKVASITKLFMGALTMMLVEDGTLSLDDPVSRWLPSSLIDKVENAGDCPLRWLLNHTSGIYDVISDQGFYLKLLNDPCKNWKPEELLAFAYNKKAEFPTGQGIQYSNTNFLLLSLVIDNATGVHHSKLLRSRIFEPLGLKDTYYYWHENLPPYFSQGYYDLYNNGSILNLTNYNTGSGNGYGGIYSTVRDMQVFIEKLLKEKTLLSDSSLTTMLTFTAEEEGSYRQFGLGIFKDYLERQGGQYGYGHRGRDLAYSADLYYFPKIKTTLSYMVNYGTNGQTALKDVFLEFRNRIADELYKL